MSDIPEESSNENNSTQVEEDPNEEPYILTYLYETDLDNESKLYKDISLEVNVKKLDVGYIVLSANEPTNDTVYEELAAVRNVRSRKKGRNGQNNSRGVLSDLGQSIVLSLSNFIRIDVYSTYTVGKDGTYCVIKDGKVYMAKLSQGQTLDLKVGDMYAFVGASIIGFTFGACIDKDGKIIFSTPFTEPIDYTTSGPTKIVLTKRFGSLASWIYRWLTTKKQSVENSSNSDVLDGPEPAPLD